MGGRSRLTPEEEYRDLIRMFALVGGALCALPERIFEIADYGICGGPFKVTPMLTEAIRAAKAAK